MQIPFLSLQSIDPSALLSVCGRTTAAVSKIADACERSAKSREPVDLTWDAEAEVPEGYTA